MAFTHGSDLASHSLWGSRAPGPRIAGPSLFHRAGAAAAVTAVCIAIIAGLACVDLVVAALRHHDHGASIRAAVAVVGVAIVASLAAGDDAVAARGLGEDEDAFVALELIAIVQASVMAKSRYRTR